MEEQEERVLHRAIVQMTDGITMIAETSQETTEEETRKAISQALPIDHLTDDQFHKIITLPITTQERWDKKMINFCPRCGRNITNANYNYAGRIRCMECDIMADIEIHKTDSPKTEDEEN